jgi:hypothetical protein
MTPRVIRLVLAGLAVSGAMSWCQGAVQASGKVSGFVSPQSDPVSRLFGVSVRFEDAVGRSVTVQTDGDGKYEATLPSGTYKVTAKGHAALCDSKRPRFLLKPNADIHFTFMLPLCRNNDVMVVGGAPGAPLPPIYCALEYESDHGESYWDEDYIPLGDNPDDYVALIHGACHKRAQKILYESAPVFDHPDARTPVTIIFGTYTILADSATFDRQGKTVTAEGKVSIFDGTADQPRASHCVRLSVAEREPKPTSCD